MRILVIGQSVRNIAISAFRAGHSVAAADCYCDLDLVEVVEVHRLRIEDLFNADKINAIVESVDPDAVVLGPGVETVRINGYSVMNNSPDRILRVSDKLWLSRWLEEREYPHATTWESDPPCDRKMILKPRIGAGGYGCRIFEGGAVPPGHIVQEFVEGVPASASVICDGSDARTIAVNEQLSGMRWLNADGFRYCGNITPLDADADVRERIAHIAEEIVAGLGLVGSNGVDFILARNKPVVIEVNPRFQGSLDTVELSTEISVFQAHLDAFDGRLPAARRARYFAGRAILYSSERIRIDSDLRRLVLGIMDVPAPGSVIEMGDPVLSIISAGSGRRGVVESLRAKRSALGQILRL
ncbi:MAG: ATP-grasp domain-containing protein [Methanothrix sp.]|uniref:ATP-grasp domain-containing protein n=1 Tax=Methanothrix sp. TaxID=90426 RepID=UPI00198A4C97|nr:ATP-grasp domain-containing protein [Methanothrix sp.]MBC7080134.1 ATP-grasp domain-containing protein [Methanothrix sp.]NPU88240.1 ATP-grasp domain-containing protein [Methanothrix sp.]